LQDAQSKVVQYGFDGRPVRDVALPGICTVVTALDERVIGLEARQQRAEFRLGNFLIKYLGSRGQLYYITNKDASNYALMKVDLNAPSSVTAVIPENEKSLLENVPEVPSEAEMKSHLPSFEGHAEK